MSEQVPDIRVRTLCVLHRVLVQARLMAYQGESHDRLATLMDDAEILAIKMAHSSDNTEEVAALLQALVAHFPELADTLAIFDGSAPNPPWRSW